MRNIRNVYAEPVAGIGFRNGDRVVQILSIPAVDREDDVFGIAQAQNYSEALNIIGEYVNITGPEEAQDEGMEMDE